MSSCNHFLELTEQLCYVQCSYCSTILLVSVPCSSLLKMVTVRCGHCASLISVNMLRASFVPLQLLASLNDHEQKQEVYGGGLTPKAHDHTLCFSSFNEEESLPVHIVNKPPEKRQRAPSAYNRFIKEEIQRLKASEPTMTHKEAFSTAAKNWAHFPRIQHKAAAGSCSQLGDDDREIRNEDVDEVDVQSEDFRERKVSRHSLWAK